jgi:hypothetical protein
MPPIISQMVALLVSRPDQLRMRMQQNRRLQFPRMHIAHP